MCLAIAALLVGALVPLTVICLEDATRRELMNWLRQQTQRAQAQPPNGRARDGSRAPSGPSMPPRRTWLTFLVILVANYLLVTYFFPGPDAPVTVPYTFFKEQV